MQTVCTIPDDSFSAPSAGWFPLSSSCRVCRFTCCTIRRHLGLGDGHAMLVPGALRSPPASTEVSVTSVPEPWGGFAVSDLANVGLFPCCFLDHCLWEMLLCWCPHAEQSFDSGRWPRPHGFGDDILPPALPWSLRQALVLFPARCCARRGIKQAFPLLSLLSNI